jgi:hypothetical protein
MLKLAAIFTITLIGLAGLAQAQTTLNPGERDFSIKTILLFDVPVQKGDYCGNPARPETLQTKLNFNGDKDFLNILWQAQDPNGLQRDIRATCYLNCPNPTVPLSASCAGYQTCGFDNIPTGQHSCSILSPAYNYKGENTVACEFNDVEERGDPVMYQARFWAIDYSTSAASKTITLGSDTTVPVDVRYFGLLQSNFTINMTQLQQTGIIIERNLTNTNNMICGDVTRVFPRVHFTLASESPYGIKVLTKSNSDITTCSTNLDCSYLDQSLFPAECLKPEGAPSDQGICWMRTDVEIRVGKASLPEYGLVGFLILIFGAAAVAWRRF